MKRLLCLSSVALLAFVATAHSQVYEGRASVIDADTIEIHGTRIRLNGIDAPEARQTCRDEAGRAYRCGQQAALKLSEYLEKSQPVECIENSRDRYGRSVATCFTFHGQDIAAWLVRNGHALDWPTYSKGKYDRFQDEAMKAAVGVWRGDFIPPWEWRASRR